MLNLDEDLKRFHDRGKLFLHDEFDLLIGEITNPAHPIKVRLSVIREFEIILFYIDSKKNKKIESCENDFFKVEC